MPLNLFGRPLNTQPVDPALLEEANRRLFAQARLDSAPAGSVGAPSGVQPAARAVDRRINPFQAAALASSPIPGLGDVMGLAADAQMYATEPESRTLGNYGLSALGLLPFVPAMTAYHGSPHLFDAFDASKIGTGEGAQAYGHGLYFAEHEGIARHYKDALSGDRKATSLTDRMNMLDVSGKPVLSSFDIEADSEFLDLLRHGGSGDAARYASDRAARWRGLADSPEYPYQSYAAEKAQAWEALTPEVKAGNVSYRGDGAIYTVDIPDEQIPKMLDWDKPIAEQSPDVQRALSSLVEGDKTLQFSPGSALVRRLESQMGKKKAAEFLQELGIPGVKYLDAGSRGTGTGTRNYVVFDPSGVKVLGRE